MLFENIFYGNNYNELVKYMEKKTINLNYSHKLYPHYPWYMKRNFFPGNPWQEVIRSGNTQIAQLLIKYEILPDEMSLAKMLSSKNEWDFETIKQLIDLGAPLNGYCEEKFYGEKTTYARTYVLFNFFVNLPPISNDSDDQILLEQLQYFHKKGNMLNVIYIDDMSGSVSPLMCVASSGYIQSTKYLLDLGVNLDLQFKSMSVFDFVAEAVAAESVKSESVYKKKINEVNHLLQNYKLRNK